VAAVKTDTAAIKLKTDNLPSDPADESLIISATDAIMIRLGTPVVDVSTDVAGVKTVADAVKSKTDNLPASPAAVSDIPTANQNADALLDRAAGVETGRTIRQAMRLMLAVLCGKVSGAATATNTFRDTNDSKDRVVSTVDADGNRTGVTLDAS
jgi:hypothetical protein